MTHISYQTSLALDTSFLRRLIIKEFAPRTLDRFSEYVKSEINPLILDSGKRFKEDQIASFYAKFGSSFEYLDRYLKNNGSYKDVDGKFSEILRVDLFSRFH